MKGENQNAKTMSKEEELLELLKEYGDFRENFEKYLWKVFLMSENLSGSCLYQIYYNLRKQEFELPEFTDSRGWLMDVSDLVYIVSMDREPWEGLYDEYDELKEYLESCGDEIEYSFKEWVEETKKDDYIANTIDLIIERLEWEIKYEQ